MKCFKCSQDKAEGEYIIFDYGCICRDCYIERFKAHWYRNPAAKPMMRIVEKIPNMPHTADELGLRAWVEMKKNYELSKQPSA